ncbi:hypothetical protein AMATHDRAFT_57929 [Amanita thiersii Skay4041]|uniref:Uncharacterized protein n=1 Tax=Amanita thiersii Skay4041 TaxID=703135 RepID=A0A2A9NRW8_9AGAR|nr:hypothetical protein AMATHDRAFT_57929 [Amanita thiersii Skay4041]
MPGRNYHKAEAKYNVTTDFPSLGLHSAAATGNLGLVEYALVHGQPVNSVLDGVLPLHAASAGGHTQVVKLLIERGADVNAPRLPRRYSNEKNRDSSAPIVGTSGSTPLHFAAANGNTNVVTMLLLHGAHANRPDKHGVTPEMLAKQNGWLECAELLRQWVLNKDRDLKERETFNTAPSLRSQTSRDKLSISSNTDQDISCSVSTRRRLQVKHSIDTALNILKSSSAFDSHKQQLSRHSVSTNTPPASPLGPCAEQAQDTESPDSGHVSPVDHGSRRPSLPHIFHSPPRSRKPSNPSSNSSITHARRPRSAGTDAEREDENSATQARNNLGKRLGTKYSLMNMFKKAHVDTVSQGNSNAAPDPRPGPKQGTMSQSNLNHGTSPHLTVPSQQGRSTRTPERHEETASPTGFRPHRNSDASTGSQPPSRPIYIPTGHNNKLDLEESQQESESLFNHGQRRFTSETNRDSPNLSSSPMSMLSSLRTRESNRERSGSNGSSYSIQSYRNLSVLSDEQAIMGGNNGETAVIKGIPVPPGGILRAHGRSSSGNHGMALSASYRTLRFGNSDTGGMSGNGLRSVNSVGSLTRPVAQGDADRGRGGAINRPRMTARQLSPITAPAGLQRFEVQHGANEPGGRSFSYDGREASPLPTLTSETHLPDIQNTDRGLSLSSSSSSSLSPIAAADVLVGDEQTEILSLPSSGPYTESLKTSNFEGPIINHQGSSGSGLDTSMESSMTPHLVKSTETKPKRSALHNSFNGRSAFEIDISSISSHAQAEALVQQAQQEILEMEELEILGSANVGNTPLSARLAAYGESLALERRLREEMQRCRVAVAAVDEGTFSRVAVPIIPSALHNKRRPGHIDKITRQHSLDDRLGYKREKIQRQSSVQRPSTAEEDEHGLPVSGKVYGQYQQDTRPATALGYIYGDELQTDNRGQSEFDILDDDLDYSRSKLNPMDSLDTGVDFGSSLHRVSTAPLAGTTHNRTKFEQARSATKLTKMGFAPTEQANRVVPAQPRMFSGLKHLMQTFKGKA